MERLLSVWRHFVRDIRAHHRSGYMSPILRASYH